MVPLLLLLPLLLEGERLGRSGGGGYRLRVQESLAVQAGLGVRVPCSFSYPWSSWYSSMEPFIYWFREGDGPHSDPVATNNPKRPVKTETQGRFRLLGDPSDKDCSLSISDARMSDTGVYYFRVERDDVKYSYRDKKLSLQVTAPPGKPYIQFPEPLEAGRPTKLTCTLSLASGGGLPLLFSWVGEAVESIDPDTLHSSELTLTPRPQDHGTNLTCWVTLQGSQVTLETTVRLNVSCECGGAAGSLGAVLAGDGPSFLWTCPLSQMSLIHGLLLLPAPFPFILFKILVLTVRKHTEDQSYHLHHF
uniref:Ig-like domain-containing protein n=1 Tax=Capra hircus TaxID=9925 RepID=A0A8C2R1V0_CAPHI